MFILTPALFNPILIVFYLPTPQEATEQQPGKTPYINYTQSTIPSFILTKVIAIKMSASLSLYGSQST